MRREVAIGPLHQDLHLRGGEAEEVGGGLEKLPG